MKNLIPSVSALSIGAASLAVTTALHAAEGGAKPWTVRAGVSGFYNDNVYTRSDLAKVNSFGFELTPGFSLNLPVNEGQTTLGLRYDYLLRYFENRAKAVDHNHVVDANLSHNFNSRFKLDVFDSDSGVITDGKDVRKISPLDIPLCGLALTSGINQDFLGTAQFDLKHLLAANPLKWASSSNSSCKTRVPVPKARCT